MMKISVANPHVNATKEIEEKSKIENTRDKKEEETMGKILKNLE